MPGIMEYPEVVKKAMREYSEVFKNQPEGEHFGEYLMGLMVAERKRVLGINREFAQTTDQSCLNRWIGQGEWEVEKLKERRLELLKKDQSTRYSREGVIAIDNVLIEHEGKMIEDVGYFWDHAEKRYTIAHDYLIANYVCTSEKHYPMEFRRFVKREQCGEDGKGFKSHTELFKGLVDWVVSKRIGGNFTMDSYFLNAEIQNQIDGGGRGYVGDMKFNRHIK